MRQRLVTVAVLTLGLALAGCGDDSGGASPFGPGGAPTGDGDIDSSVGDLLDDLSDGSLDSTDLGDLMETAENMAESFGDSGAGTVSINGDTIEFSSEICFSGQGDFTIEGAGTTDSGVPVWVSISRSVDSREDLAEFMGDDMVEMVYGDADPIVADEFSVEYGRTEMFGSGSEDMPDFHASSGTIGQDEMQMSVDGQSASGSGAAADYNYVAGEFDARFDFTFSAGCG